MFQPWDCPVRSIKAFVAWANLRLSLVVLEGLNLTMSLAARPRSASQSTRLSGRSARSNKDREATPQPPPQTITPAADNLFQACTSTASFFLYAQANVILCLHHDTLTIERRFERHRDSVLWISADNVSEKGSGRLVVSYDASQTTIVWDVLTGDEVARFASFEEIKVAAWMRSGNIAFGRSVRAREMYFC